MKTHCLAITFALFLSSTVSLAQEEPPTSTPTPTTPALAPQTGFSVEGRLRSSGGSLSGSPLLLGWRGERVALLVGPFFDHFNVSHHGEKATSAGAILRTEISAARFAGGKIEAYVPVEGSVGGFFQDDVHTVQWSVGAGLGARYWVTPGFALFAEGGVEVKDSPSGSSAYYEDGSSFAMLSGRVVEAQVTSALGLVLTF